MQQWLVSVKVNDALHQRLGSQKLPLIVEAPNIGQAAMLAGRVVATWARDQIKTGAGAASVDLMVAAGRVTNDLFAAEYLRGDANMAQFFGVGLLGLDAVEVNIQRLNNKET